MANRMSDAMDRLLRRQMEGSGETVLYNGVPVDVIVARSDHDMITKYGAEITALVQDFIIPTEQYAPDPQIGDRIVRDNGTIYAVADTGERYEYDTNCWRWSDSYHRMRRVHAKQVPE